MGHVRKSFPIAKAIVALVVVVGLVVAVRMLPVAEWLQSFQRWVRGAGTTGYVLYSGVYILSCLLVLPAVALTIGAGAIFGFVEGSILVVISATLGATAAFLLARSVMRHRVERMTSGNAKFRELDRAITKEGTKIMWLVRLSGFPPFTWVNYAFGLTGIRLMPFIMITFLGIIPGTLAFTWAGAAGAAAMEGAGNRLILGVTAGGAVLVSVFIARIALKAIHKAGVDEEE